MRSTLSAAKYSSRLGLASFGWRMDGFLLRFTQNDVWGN
jgi:hypothetical protein